MIEIFQEKKGEGQKIIKKKYTLKKYLWFWANGGCGRVWFYTTKKIMIYNTIVHKKGWWLNWREKKTKDKKHLKKKLHHSLWKKSRIISNPIWSWCYFCCYPHDVLRELSCRCKWVWYQPQAYVNQLEMYWDRIYPCTWDSR